MYSFEQWRDIVWHPFSKAPLAAIQENIAIIQVRDAGSLDGVVMVKLVRNDGWSLAVLMDQILSVREREK